MIRNLGRRSWALCFQHGRPRMMLHIHHMGSWMICFTCSKPPPVSAIINDSHHTCEFLSTFSQGDIIIIILQKQEHTLQITLTSPYDDVLPYTGAVTANYVNEATAAWLRSIGVMKRGEAYYRRTRVYSKIGSTQQFCVP